MRNIYDNSEFFAAYAEMGRSKDGLKAAGEWHQLQPLFPKLQGKKVLDLGCGYGWHCKYAAQMGATEILGIDSSQKMIAKAVGEMIHAFADATVPKVNVVIGKAYGTAYVAMNSKSVGADLVYAWDNAEIGMMDASLAAKIMYPGEEAAVLNEKAAVYRELQSNVESAAARGYVDTVIAPADTRKYVIGAFEMLFTKREDRPSKKHGTV